MASWGIETCRVWMCVVFMLCGVTNTPGCHCRQRLHNRMRADFEWHWRSLWTASVDEREPSPSMVLAPQHWRVKALAGGTQRGQSSPLPPLVRHPVRAGVETVPPRCLVR